MIFQLLVFAYFITTAFSSPISPHLFCEEKRWQSIFVFLATNYIAHALTTIPNPGVKWKDHLFTGFVALLLPNIFLIGAIINIVSHFVQGGSDDLHQALSQRALLILVKTKDIVSEDEKIDPDSRRVHGEIKIPPGYALIVPSLRRHRGELAPAFRKSKDIAMGRSTEVASAVIAIAQVIFSSITIYRTRGDQIEKYGYTAYGLSVYPYALMSLANLIQLAACGRYPFAYVLRTTTLVEAEKIEGVFEGAVGNLKVNRGEGDEVVNDSEHIDPMAVFSEPPSWLKFVSPPWFRPLGDYGNRQWIAPITGSLITVIAIISQPVFVFLISGLNHGQSTRAQRIWMLGWLVANEVSVMIGLVSWSTDTERSYWGIVVGILTLSVSVFAIGGFVTVGGMLRAESYQLCNS